MQMVFQTDSWVMSEALPVTEFMMRTKLYNAGRARRVYLFIFASITSQSFRQNLVLASNLVFPSS